MKRNVSPANCLKLHSGATLCTIYVQLPTVDINVINL